MLERRPEFDDLLFVGEDFPDNGAVRTGSFRLIFMNLFDLDVSYPHSFLSQYSELMLFIDHVMDLQFDIADLRVNMLSDSFSDFSYQYQLIFFDQQPVFTLYLI